VKHTFVWAAQADLSGKVASVTLRLTPRRGHEAGVAVERTLLAGLTPPKLAIVPPPPSTQPASRDVVTTVTVSDDGSGAVDIPLFVTAPGIPRREVSLVGATTGVATAPGGVTATVGWSSTDATALGFVNTTATVEVDVVDRFGQTAVATESLQFVN